jgi:hypothetical protein
MQQNLSTSFIFGLCFACVWQELTSQTELSRFTTALSAALSAAAPASRDTLLTAQLALAVSTGSVQLLLQVVHTLLAWHKANPQTQVSGSALTGLLEQIENVRPSPSFLALLFFC